MNRHHYGLYVHGQKLVLLLRKEAEDVKSSEDMQTFRPAEFRWKIPHVTDDKWHHYAVNVDIKQESSDGGVSFLISLSLYISFDVVVLSYLYTVEPVEQYPVLVQIVTWDVEGGAVCVLVPGILCGELQFMS